MDRSVDSIGSCSLDVNADSTDVSGKVFIILYSILVQFIIVARFIIF